MILYVRTSAEKIPQVVLLNVRFRALKGLMQGALIIRIGFWAPLSYNWYNYHEEGALRNNGGNFLGFYI